jgi:hypothetical protein
MAKTRSGGPANRRGRVQEFFTAATLPALDRVLMNRGIDPHTIVSIIETHGQPVGSSKRHQFGVLYEAH